MRAHFHALEALYREFDTTPDVELSILDRTLDPRPASLLHDIVAVLGLGPEHVVLDLGCGRGVHTCDLAVRFRCDVIGLDLSAKNLDLALKLAQTEQVVDRVAFVQAQVEDVPLPDRILDFIWSRDVTLHVTDMAGAFREWARILRPGGYMTAYVRSATELMEPREAARLYKPLRIRAHNMVAGHVEAAIEASGFQVQERQELGSELMEYFEERDGRCSRELMRIARLMRARRRFESELGSERYAFVLASYLWVIYQVIGKITTTIYTLRVPG